jgi:hypothetical protein
MTKALICDRCGMITDVGVGAMRAIWVTNPMFDNLEENCFHLCNACYERFESEYAANLKGQR